MLLAMLQVLEHRRSTNDASCFGHLGGYRMDYLASFFCRGFPLQLHPSSGLRIARGNLSHTVRKSSRQRPLHLHHEFPVGAFNLPVALYLLSKHPVTVSFEPGFLALVFGALAIGFYLSLHFGKGGRDPKADDAVRAPNTGRRSGA